MFILLKLIYGHCQYFMFVNINVMNLHHVVDIFQGFYHNGTESSYVIPKYYLTNDDVTK